MEFHEFGDERAPAILINHGMMQHWKSLYDFLSPLAKHYRLIFAAMDGFYEGSGTFTSFADQARQIEEYVHTHHNGCLHGAYGISQGGLMLTELLTRNNIQIKTAIMDGCYVAHQGYLSGRVTAWMFCKYKNTGKFPALIHIMMKLMGTTLEEMGGAMMHAMYWDATDESVHRNMLENYTYHARPELTATDTLVHLWCGSKEPYALKSHRILKKYLHHYEEVIMPGLGHGDFLMKHTQEACEKIRNALG